MKDTDEEYWTIASKGLFDLVNDKRRLRNKSPIDHGTIRTRLSLKCGVICPGSIDFAAEEIRLNAEMIPRIEGAVNELFDLYLDNELKRYCKYHAPRAVIEEALAAQVRAEQAAVAPVVEESAGGLGGMLRRMFRR